MATAIANIGTSALLVKIDDHYLPIGFDRNEVNADFSTLSQSKYQIWELRNKIVATKLCSELEVKVIEKTQKNGNIIYIFSFRELTKRILEEYQKNPDLWSNRLRLGRISGVIEEAQTKFDVQQAHIFVTDQSTDENPNGHQGDTCYLFDILNALTANSLSLFPVSIKENAVDADNLLETYYDFFNRTISEDETVLVSIKGGTPQMQTALKMQAIASGIPNLLFIDPQFAPDRVIRGKNSRCKITSYWRYIRSQKYQTVKLLLESRWDFQGAKVILKEWRSTLSFLQQYLQPEDIKLLQQEQEKLKSIITQLNTAGDYLNFASETKDRDKLHSTLNLYTQCRIYWNLEEIANFLPRLGTFYEETIKAIIVELGGEKYFERNNQNKKWNLASSSLEQELKERYEQAERRFIWDSRLWKVRTAPKTKNDTCEKILGYEFKWYESQRLSSRYRKKSFAEALIYYSNDQNIIYFWEKINSSLAQVDYWVDQRNSLVHGVKGLSIRSMRHNHDRDKLDYQNSSEEEQQNPYNCDPNQSCDAGEIINQMSVICHNTLKLFGKSQSEYVDIKEPQKSEYYLYSEIKRQVIKDLMDNC